MLEYHSWVSPTGGDVESVSARAVIICVGLKSVGQRGNNELRNYKQQQSDQTKPRSTHIFQIWIIAQPANLLFILFLCLLLR